MNQTFTPQDIFKLMIPFGIFLLGYMLNDIREKQKERRRLNRLKDYVLMWAGLILKPLETQIEFYKDFITHINKHHDESITQTKVKIPIENLITIDKVDFATFTVFKQIGDISENTRLYYKFQTALNKIEAIQSNASIIYKNYCDDYLEKYEDFSQKYMKLRHDLENKLNVINLQPPFAQLKTPYLQISNLVFTQQNQDLGVLRQRIFIRDNYLQPLNLLMNGITHQLNTPDLLPDLQTISYLLAIVQHYIDNNNKTVEFYSKFEEELSSAKLEIVECTKEIERKELVDWVDM